MPTVRIQVAGTEGPQYGKKRGRIKDTNGALYQALPSFLGMVQIGGTYDLTYKDDSFNGTAFRVVEGVTPAIGGQPGGVTPITPGGPMPMPPPQARPAQNYGAPQQEDARGDDIATMAIVKEWIGRIPVGDAGAVAHALRSARRAWKMFKANPDNIETGRQPLADDGYEAGDPGP